VLVLAVDLMHAPLECANCNDVLCGTMLQVLVLRLGLLGIVKAECCNVPGYQFISTACHGKAEHEPALWDSSQRCSHMRL